MKKILFRGKRVDNGEWLDGNLVTYPSGTYKIVITTSRQPIFGTLKEVIPETVGQYTGLEDKEKNRVFTGDVVKNDCGDIGLICLGTYKVWSTAHFGFYIDWHNDKHLRPDILYWFDEDRVSVIGNIHDTPELLEDSDD